MAPVRRMYRLRRLAEPQTDEGQTELLHLREQLDAQRRKVQSLRGVIEALRDKLAKERAARAVLAARLIERQAEEQKSIQASIARMEAAQVGSGSKQENEALRQLAAALYRSMAGRWSLPADLPIPGDLDPLSPARHSRHSRQSHLAFGVTPGPQWHQLLLGKKSGTTLHAPDGTSIALEGETIGPENVEAAMTAGMLLELILHMKVAEKIPDL